MADERRRRTLGDYFTLQRGTTYKSRQLGQPGPVLLGLATIQRNGGFRTDSLQTYGGGSPDRLLVQPGELYVSLKDVTQSADLLGAVARLPHGHLAGRLTQDTVKLEPKTDDVPVDYLYWVLRTPQYRAYCRAHATGTTNLGLSRRDFLAFSAPEPTPQQLVLVGTLNTLDYKIELNRQMNETLEAMARAVFESWFVDFDPVRAKAEGRDTGLPRALADLFPDSFEESELGDIPRGWRAGRLDVMLTELVSGARPVGGAVERGVPSIGAENVIGLGRYDFAKEKFVPHDFFNRIKVKGAAVQNGDVLLYKDGAQIGRKTYFDRDFPHTHCAINEHVFILRARRPGEQRFLYFWLDQDWMTHEIVSLNSNSAQPGINQTGVRGLPVLLPHERVIDAFDQIAGRLTDRLFANCHESQTLAAIRDALLQKLVTGEIGIPFPEESLGPMS